MAKTVRVVLKSDPDRVREEFRDLIRQVGEISEQARKVWMALATRAFEIQKNKFWLRYRSAKTGYFFTSFNQWLCEDAGGSRSKIFPLLRVVQFLPLPANEIEAIGQQKAEELSKIAKYKEHRLPTVLEQVRNNPDMTVTEVHDLVSGELAGQHLAPQRYQRFEFAVPAADAGTIKDALRVAQEMDPLEDPDNPVSMGLLLTGLIIDWLGYPEPTQILKELNKKSKKALPAVIDEEED